MDGVHGVDGPAGVDVPDSLDSLDGLDEIVAEFLVESHENLDQLDRDLVALEQDPGSTGLLSSVFRTIHTIKGTSGFLAFDTLESVTHSAESLLARLRDGRLALTPALTTLLLEVVDAVRRLLGEIERTRTEGTETYADLVERLQAVLEGRAAEEFVTDTPVADAQQVQDRWVETESGGEDRRTVADSSVRVDVGLLDSLMNLVGELVLTRNQMLQRAATRADVELARTTHRLDLIAGELQEGVMKTRMQQIDNLWSKLPRMVRDLSVQLGKSVDLRMEGKETELDRTILEAVRDPLTHLVRNSVDHGIEAPDERRAAGKAETGILTLRAFHEGGQVTIEISDDGAGIDPARLRERAVGKGILTRDAAEALSDHEATDLIFSPGFSTATAVTNVSGRGVGMDVVRTNIEKIGGTVDLASVPGNGTTVRIRIPLTLAIIPALVVTADHRRYAIPQVNLLELVRLDEEQAAAGLEKVHGAPVHRLRGHLLPLVDLREQLGLPPAAGDTTYIVVLRADNHHFGLVVDDILDTEEIVVKPLGAQLRTIPLYAGATIMGDGTVALILDATAIARRAGMSLETAVVEEQSAPEAGPTESLLVVTLTDGRRAAIPVAAVDRLEEIDRAGVERAGTHDVVQYRGSVLPLLSLDDALHGRTDDLGAERLQVVVCRSGTCRFGLVVAGIVDIVDADLSVRTALDSTGRTGSAVVAGHVTELVDIDHALAGLAGGRLARTG